MYHSKNNVILNTIRWVGHRYDANSITQGSATPDSGWFPLTGDYVMLSSQQFEARFIKSRATAI